MANASAGNVRRIDTTALIPGPIEVRSIRYVVTGASPSASLKGDSSGGVTVWETAAAAEFTDQDLGIYNNTGLYVTVSNAVIYLYLCDD